MNEKFFPQPYLQTLMKNRLEIEKLQAKQISAELSKQVGVSELKKVKGFWDKTIATLIENGIETIQQFKEIDYDKAMTFLTPVQWHQINLFIKDNNI